MKTNANLDNLQLANIVVKDSKTGFSSNKRLLVLKTGYLYYYSDVPKSFNGEIKSLQSKDESIPKCSIEISNILSIKGDFRTPLQFEIQFEARNMMQKNDIRKTLRLQQFNFAPKNTTQMIKWKFTCQSRQVRDKWIQSLKSLKDYFAKQKVNIQKFFKSISKDPHPQQIYSPRKSTKVPWKSSQQQKKLQEEKLKGIAAQQLKKKKKIEEQQKKQKQRKKKLEEERMKKEQQEKRKQKQLQEQLQKQKKQMQEQQKQRRQQQQLLKKIQQQKRLRQIQQQQQKIKLKQEMELIKKGQKQNQALLEKRLIRLSINNQIPNKRDQQQKIQLRIQQADNYNETPLSQNRNLKNQLTIQSQSLENLITSTQFFSNNFKDKIQKQKDFYINYSNFRDKCAIHFQQIIDQLSFQVEKRSFKIPANKIVQVEDIIFKIAMTYSRSITINGMSKYFYDESEIKNIKREFQFYNFLQVKINKQLKQGKQIRIRVPIVCFIEYKGVACLAFKQNSYERNAQDIDQSVQEQLSLLEIPGEDIILKNTYNNCLTIYVKKAFKIKKSRNINFQSPLTPQFLRIAQKERVCTSIKNLRSHKQKLNQVKKTPYIQQIKQGLQFAIFCKYIRKLYRSAQGQIQQQNFWNLILKKDKNIIQMILNQGCQKIPQYKTILFSYIKYYFETTFQFTNPSDPFSSKFPLKGLTIKPITRTFKISLTELDQSIHNFDKYLKEGKLALAQQSYQIKQEIVKSKFQSETYVKTIIDKALLLQYQNDVIESIKECKRALELLPYHDCNKFDIFAILLKNYQYSENQMMELFKNWSQLIHSNYGKDHYSLISLYCIMAHFFGRNKQNIPTGLKLYTLSIELCIRLYGKDSIQSGNIYLDISKMYKYNNRLNEAFEYLEKARKIYIKFGQNTIQYTRLLTYSSILYNLRNDTMRAQEAIQSAFLFLQKTNNTKQQLIQAYKIGLHIYDSQDLLSYIVEILEKIWNLGEYNNQYYKTTIELSFKHILKKLTTEDLQIFEQLTNRASQMQLSLENEIDYMKKLKKGYMSVHQLIEDIVSTLINLRNNKNAQYEILYEAYVHILHYVSSQLIIGIIQSLK